MLLLVFSVKKRVFFVLTTNHTFPHSSSFWQRQCFKLLKRFVFLPHLNVKFLKTSAYLKWAEALLKPGIKWKGNLIFTGFFSKSKKKDPQFSPKMNLENKVSWYSNRRAPVRITRAQYAFEDSMIHGILQFTLRIAVRCVLHRCASQEIHR